MLELVQRAHEKQSRNGGRVPYWMHLLSVAQILDWALDVADELPDDAAREDLYLAALGHDLYEDTAVQPIDVRLSYGERVDGWIQGMTNPGGDNDRAAYHRQMAAAPEEVRLIKLADMTENTASCSYAIADMGVEWMTNTFVPIIREMRDVVERTRFDKYENAAGLLSSLLAYHFERLERNLWMFELADQLKRATPGKQPGAGKAAPQQISQAAWERALARTRERERKEGERFRGRLFPIPDKED
jgi:hypothetical protein